MAKKVRAARIKNAVAHDKYEEALIKELFAEDLARIQKKLSKSNDNEDEELHYFKGSMKHEKRGGEWDVPIEEEIMYFDPELSYELTGYRPINELQGLDFDPTPFQEAANNFMKAGSYSEFPERSMSYTKFWTEEIRRCVLGYTVGKYTVTGDHYFFLNYYQMQTINSADGNAISSRSVGFPSFLSKQYEFFHYLSMCEKTGKDCVLLKARGLGFSEILACIGARPFVTNWGYRTTYTAAAAGQLTPVLEKCWQQLNWLNKNTNGGMKRLRQKVDNILHKRASLVDGEGVEYGSMTNILGIVADNPRKVRGERVDRLILEEAGSNPNLMVCWIQWNPLVHLGGRKTGLKVAGGTGGDSGPQLAGLAKLFNNPDAYGILPYKHFDTRDGKVQYSAFFIPAHRFSLHPDYMDHRGVTDSTRFRAYYQNKRNKLDGADLLTESAENCFTPEEALLKQGDNLFDAATISDQLTRLRVHKEGVKPVRTALIYDKTNESKTVKAIPSSSSKLLIYEPPILDADGNPYSNLYVAGIDAIDMGEMDSTTNQGSEFCIVIKKRMHGLSEPQYVAMYMDRPRNINEAFEISLKLLLYYNCKAMLEYTKISIQQYFKGKGYYHLFMSRPEFAVANTRASKRKKRTLIGVNASESVIKHGLELINIYVNEYCYNIYIDEMLDQLLNYSYEHKTKFDIIAAMAMAEIGDEEMMDLSIVTKSERKKEWHNVGYYIDSNGIKRYGKIK